ncbi:MAG: dienelactone hydrolase family protein [Chloroflexi bacterium]|nr:dienelactone hydrolase family protein [Chloroflexota bacterium]
MGNLTFLTDGQADAADRFVLAHGAGAPMDSPTMEAIATGVAAAGIRVVRFEFPYMRQRRGGGRRRPPDRQAVLLETWHEVIGCLGGSESLVIGGRSMGGRMASLIADAVGARGLVCLGYPFHPPGKPEKLRTEHLADLRTPTLIVQGERDAFGSKAEVGGYALSDAIRVHWLADGDHSFVPRKRSGHTAAGHLAEAAAVTAEFIQSLSHATRG